MPENMYEHVNGQKRPIESVILPEDYQGDLLLESLLHVMFVALGIGTGLYT